jgi:rRNA processing protein Gar1
MTTDARDCGRDAEADFLAGLVSKAARATEDNSLAGVATMAVSAAEPEDHGATSSESEDYCSAAFLERERLLLQGFEAVDYDEEDETDAEDEPLDVASVFGAMPQCVADTDSLEALGRVSVPCVGPMAVIKPANAALVLDIGTAVVASADRAICGAVWDVFGPIDAPLYAVAVRPGCEACFAPGAVLRYSRDAAVFVSTETLRREHGTDADPGCADEFSDDEAERLHRRGLEPGEV